MPVSTDLHPRRKLHQTGLAWSLLRPYLVHSCAVPGRWDSDTGSSAQDAPSLKVILLSARSPVPELL